MLGKIQAKNKKIVIMMLTAVVWPYQSEHLVEQEQVTPQNEVWDPRNFFVQDKDMASQNCNYF